TSRGCPWRCGFCYTLAHNKRTWRAMSPERVVQEFKYVKEVLGVRDLFLFDDEFFIDLKRVAAIADLLEKENLDMRLHNVNCRAGSLCRMDMGLLKKMRRVGLHYILVGVESGSPRVLDSMKKDMTIDEVIEANQRCIEADITPYFSFMCGFPQETEEDVRLTLKLQERLLRDNPRAMVSKTVFYYPFPGTPMFDEAVEQYGFEAPQSLDEWATYIDSPKHYRNVPENQHAFAEDAAIFTVFLDTKFIEIKNPVLRLMANIYSLYLRTAIRYDLLGRRPLGMTALRAVYHAWHKRKGLLEE
ncbi:MAG: B12-binding domain-containing radical SAM protein, partial [Myxococcales bacterium]|nr:B12-binding domain-containing radical SAM protein [Myxococcales bacterium]